jgi:hypothetical protein
VIDLYLKIFAVLIAPSQMLVLQQVLALQYARQVHPGSPHEVQLTAWKTSIQLSNAYRYISHFEKRAPEKMCFVQYQYLFQMMPEDS